MDTNFLWILFALLGLTLVLVGFFVTREIIDKKVVYVVDLWIVKLFGRETRRTVKERPHVWLSVVGILVIMASFIILAFHAVFHRF